MKRILTPVGYWQGGTYYYFLKDHLGSNRVVITGSGAVVEVSSYYPSGMRFGETAMTGSVQPYRHTGHEMQEMHGLNWIDNLARFRTISDGGGFTGVDPLAEKYYSISPYAYCGGDPMNRFDPNGMYYYDWNTKEYKTDDGKNVVSFDEVKNNNFKEPLMSLVGLESSEKDVSIDEYFQKNDPDNPLWVYIKKKRLEDIKTKQIEIGTDWVEGMPTMLDKNGKILVVSNETGKYIDILDESLVEKFDNVYYQKHKLYRTGREISIVDDARFVESFFAAYAYDANPNPLSKINIMGSYIDGINYYKNVATKDLITKKINYYQKYNIIK